MLICFEKMSIHCCALLFQGKSVNWHMLDSLNMHNCIDQPQLYYFSRYDKNNVLLTNAY